MGYICFGPVASFTASGLLTSIGALILRNVQKKRELLFAAFPAIFALQQFIEGVLWLLLKAQKSEALVRSGIAANDLIIAGFKYDGPV